MNDRTMSDEARKRRHRNERIVAGIIVLLCAAAAGGIALWSRSERDALNGLYIPGQTEITPDIELLREFVRIDSSTPPGAATAARWVAGWLTAHGIRAEIIESAPGRLNVYARLRGRRPGGGLLLFNHVDVVAPGGGWKTPPFAASVGLNQLWGRGTLDMKGLAITQMLAFAEIANSGDQPEHDLVFLSTCDEETGSQYGMRWIIEHRPDVFADVQYGITEGGITEMMSERMTYFGIEVGSKQLVDLTLTGNDLDSMRRARIALEPYIFPREAERVTPAVRLFFRELAPTRMAFKPLLADIDRTIREGSFWRLPPSYRDLVQNSMWVSAPVQRGNGWEMYVKQVNLPDENPDARIAWLEKQVAPYGLKLGQIKEKSGPIPVSPSDTPLFRILQREASHRYQVEAGTQLLYRSTSDARFLRPRGVFCYGVSPFPVDFYQSSSIHAANERIRLDAFLSGIDYMKTVVRAWAELK